MDELPTDDAPKANPRKKKDDRKGIRHGLTAGKLPSGCQHIENSCNDLRRQVEDAVIASRGEVGLLDAAAIQTAVKWERHGALALRWLRMKESELKPVEQLAFSREIARASTERDKALAMLRLDAKPIDAYGAWLEGAQRQAAIAAFTPSEPATPEAASDPSFEPDAPASPVDAANATSPGFDTMTADLVKCHSTEQNPAPQRTDE